MKFREYVITESSRLKEVERELKIRYPHLSLISIVRGLDGKDRLNMTARIGGVKAFVKQLQDKYPDLTIKSKKFGPRGGQEIWIEEGTECNSEIT